MQSGDAWVACDAPIEFGDQELIEGGYVSGETAWGAFFLVAVAVGGYMLYQRHEDAKAPTIEQQRFCSEISSKFVKDFGINGPVDGSYSNHFNVHYGKCFVEIGMTSNLIAGMIIREVYDPAEHIQLADYSYAIPTNGKSGVSECWAKLPGEEQKQCKSEDDFKKFVEPLMGSATMG